MDRDIYIRRFKIILSWIVIFSLPLSVIGIAGNLVTRMPDVYQHTMNNTQILDGLDYSVKVTDVADAISEYMTFRNNEFGAKISVDEEEIELFDAQDKAAMENYRDIMNKVAIFTFINLLITVGTYVLFVIQGNHQILRIRFKWAAGVSLVLLAICGAGTFIHALSSKIYFTAFGVGLSETSLLYKILCTDLKTQMFLWFVIASVIVMIIFGSITWSLTKPKGIFGKY